MAHREIGAVPTRQPARVPTRRELARTALGVIFGAAALVIGWIEVFWRQCL